MKNKSTRLQPNHPTDDPAGIAASILDGLLTLLAHVREFDRASLGLALATLLAGVVLKRWLPRWPGLLIALVSASLVVWCCPRHR